MPQRPFGNDEDDLVASQLGLITTQQAFSRGETAATIRSKTKRGEWVRIERGIYRVALFPVTPRQTVLAPCLRGPGKTWASHRTAAWLHGLAGGPPQVTEITTSGQIKGTPDLRVHRTTFMTPADITRIGTIPATAVERTLIDFAAEASIPDIRLALDEALIGKRTSIAKIEWRLRRIGGKGRPGSAQLQKCLTDLQKEGEVDSRLERRFLDLLKEGRLPPPQLQYPIKLASRTVFADFAFPEQKLIVEVMGYRWHGGRRSWERDLLRSSELGAMGWRLIYVTWKQMRRERLETIDRVRRALGYEPLFIH